MLNAEKYRDEILRKAMCNFTKKNCFSPYCDALENVSKKTTCEAAVEWLFSEYEPDFLKNGDGLKPGDWIMVKQDKRSDYEKRAFAYYYDGLFYCVPFLDKLEEGNCFGWKYARLPEDGE